jgi:transposase
MKQKEIIETTGSRRRRYDAQFKSDALQLIQQGRSVAEVAKSLGVSEQLLYNWKSKIRVKILKEAPKEQVALYTEMESLRKQLRIAEMERDILKKALAVFSQIK